MLITAEPILLSFFFKLEGEKDAEHMLKHLNNIKKILNRRNVKYKSTEEKKNLKVHRTDDKKR